MDLLLASLTQLNGTSAHFIFCGIKSQINKARAKWLPIDPNKLLFNIKWDIAETPVVCHLSKDGVPDSQVVSKAFVEFTFLIVRNVQNMIFYKKHVLKRVKDQF